MKRLLTLIALAAAAALAVTLAAGSTGAASSGGGKRIHVVERATTDTVVGEAWECYWTTFLPRGQITVEGPFYDAADSTLAITGGTGAYRNARGTMDLRARSATEFDFVFHVIG